MTISFGQFKVLAACGDASQLAFPPLDLDVVLTRRWLNLLVGVQVMLISLLQRHGSPLTLGMLRSYSGCCAAPRSEAEQTVF